MSHLLSKSEPVELWDFFYQLTRIPHASGNEQAICRYVFDYARQLGLDVVMDRAGGDDFGNILVKCPAVKGFEDAPVVIFQNHLDMVGLPAENRDRPLELLMDGTMLRARGNTLGADNGIGVAMALALMTHREIVHGPLELLFTINEEAGMSGVIALSDQLLQGRYLINADSQQEDILTIGCAGVNRSLFHLPLAMEAVDQCWKAYCLRISGGKGGHSGLEINSGRANAGQQLARLLYEESKTLQLYLADINWGIVDNAIPAEASAVVLLRPEEEERLLAALPRWRAILTEEFGRVESSLALDITEMTGCPSQAAGRAWSEKILAFLLALPHGVETMSMDVEGLVETSSTVAFVRTSPQDLTVRVSQRGLSDASLDAIITRCEATGCLAGARVTHVGKAYGWKPNQDSRLLALGLDAYRQVYQKEPKVQGLHGMLEVALIKAKYPHIDMLSLGPTILDAHAPTKPDYVCGKDAAAAGERIDTARLPRFWEFILCLLEKLAKTNA